MMLRKSGIGALSFMLLCGSFPAAAQNPVVYNGGITFEERAATTLPGTKLVFFVTSGSFLSSIQVVVKDSGGREVVNTRSLGPWLILDLPNGRYQVLATRNDGEAQGGYIDVDGSNKEYAYMFPDE